MRDGSSAYHDASNAIDIETYAVTESPGFWMGTIARLNDLRLVSSLRCGLRQWKYGLDLRNSRGALRVASEAYINPETVLCLGC